MDLSQIIKDRDSLRASTSEGIDSGNPLDAIDIPEFHAAYPLPPGALAEFMLNVANNFETREDSERMRIAAALGLAQLIMGRNVLGPTKSKCSFSIFMIAASGGGKGSMINFICAAAKKLGLSERLSISQLTSTKQIKTKLISSGGSLLYIADDCPTHLASWSDPRSPLGETSSWFRSCATMDWEPESTIKRDLADELAKHQNPKTICAIASAQGWSVPRVSGTEGVIDYKKLANMPHDCGVNLKNAMEAYELACKGVENIKFIPFITATKEQGISTVSKWKADGGMGRSLFILAQEKDIGEKSKKRPNGEVSKSIINEWKPRIPTSVINVKFKDKEVEQYYDILDRRIDSSRNLEGISGHMGARYGQMIIDLATVCAFFDIKARDGQAVFIDVNHLEWAFSVAITSMKEAREFLEGEEESDGLEQTEWEKLVAKVQKWTNSKTFDKPYISTLKNNICRDRVKKIVAASASNNMPMTDDKFTVSLVLAIAENKNSPINLDEENPSKIVLSKSGSWSELKMNPEMRNILGAALKKLRFTKVK